MLKTNYPVSLSSTTQTPKEFLAVDNALVFETSELSWLQSPGKLPQALEYTEEIV